MATRRMFSLKIIDTDYFLDLPMSSQNLYFHLALRADDDGFISAPKRIMRMMGSSEDDYKVLVSKNFIIPFESGVCVIKHWLIHNQIRKDRYTPTFHQYEKNMIDNNDNGYELVSSDCIQEWQPNGNQMATQVSIGKVRLDISAEKEEETTNVLPEKEIKPIILTSSQDRFMGILKGIEGYKLDMIKDLEMYERMESKYPNLDLVEAIEQFAMYKMDKPLSKSSNARAQISTSFKKYDEWGKCKKGGSEKNDASKTFYKKPGEVFF